MYYFTPDSVDELTEKICTLNISSIEYENVRQKGREEYRMLHGSKQTEKHFLYLKSRAYKYGYLQRMYEKGAE